MEVRILPPSLICEINHKYNKGEKDMWGIVKNVVLYLGVQSVVAAADQAVRTVVAEKIRGKIRKDKKDKKEEDDDD